MHILGQAILLFALNLLDAILTIYWVRMGYASEGNQLMARLLEAGDVPFLLVKLAVGSIAAIVLWKFRSFRLAKVGLSVSLFLYVALMGVHFFTGLSAFGYLSDSFVFTSWTRSIFALFV